MSTLNFGTYTLELTVLDGVDKPVSVSNTVRFILDNTKPIVEFLSPSGRNVAIAGRVSIRGSSTDADSNIITDVKYYIVPNPTTATTGATPDYEAVAPADWKTSSIVPGNNALVMEDNPSYTWTISIENTHNLT